MALLEKNSTDFHPPINCNFKELKGQELKNEQEDRDLIVCATGLDAHYKLDAIHDVGSSGVPSLKTFNPRMSSPACPSPYTGKFLTPEEEDDDKELKNNCVKRSMAIGKKTPYREKLYEKFEPRKNSKTVVIRDYVCKVPLDVTNLTEVAKAVLVDYPDQYIQFLSSFVDNMFGESMKRFLQNSWEKYETLKKDKEEINRVSWSFYSTMHKGRGSYTKKATGYDYTPSTSKFCHADHTLQWDEEVISKINDMNSATGRYNTEIQTASDLIDLIPCLDHHIAVLKEMHASCKSFATSELNARLMMEYTNMQGRNMCDDFMLIEDGETPEYRNITLKVPISLFAEKQKETEGEKDSSLDSTIRGTGNCASESLPTTTMLDIPVGYFAGSIFNSGIRLNSSYESETRWGWGHPANVFQNYVTSSGASSFSSLPFYLPLTFEPRGGGFDTVKVSSDNKQWTIGVFKDKMWQAKWKQKNVTRVTASKTDLTLDSLLDASRSEEKKYRGVMDLASEGTDLNDTHEDEYRKKYPVEKHISVCKTGNNVVNVPAYTVVHPLLMDQCIEYKGGRVLLNPSQIIPPAIFTYDRSNDNKYNNLERNTSPAIMNIIRIISDAANITQHIGDCNKYYEDKKAPNYDLFNGLDAASQPYRGSDEDHFKHLLESGEMLEKMKKALKGIESFDRNVALVPGLPFNMCEIQTATKSVRSQGIYRLKNPDELKMDDSVDCRMKHLDVRDRLICKISFLRYLLQFSFGMNTAALVYEELFTDHELIALRITDDLRHNNSTEKRNNIGYYFHPANGLSRSYMSPVNASPMKKPFKIGFMDFIKVMKNFNILQHYTKPNAYNETKSILRDGDLYAEYLTRGFFIEHNDKTDYDEDVSILETMLKRIIQRFQLLLKHVDNSSYADEYTDNMEEISETDLKNHFPGLASRKKYLEQVEQRYKNVLKGEKSGFTTYAVRDLIVASKEEILAIDHDVSLLYGGTNVVHWGDGPPMEFNEFTKHFGSQTEVLYDFMVNNNENMTTSCDTLNYINSVYSVRCREDWDDNLFGDASIDGLPLPGEHPNSESIVADWSVTAWVPGSLDGAWSYLETNKFRSPRYNRNWEEIFHENTCMLRQDSVEKLQQQAKEWRRTRNDPITRAILPGSIKWDDYKIKSEKREKYVRPQKEIDYFRFLDVRATYCSTLKSFKEQVLQTANGRENPEFWMESMSETSIIQCCMKELKRHKVFSSQAFYIMKNMLFEDQFMYESKETKRMNEMYDNNVSESKFRSTHVEDEFEIKHTTVAKDGKTFFIPYQKDEGILGDGVDYNDLTRASTNNHSFYPTSKGDMSGYIDRLYYNDVRSEKGAMLFSMMDAAGFAWAERKYSTPGENVRPKGEPTRGHQDKMHYWSRTFVESFVNSREVHAANREATMPWEVAVRLFPEKCFKSTMIGGMCERTWKELFPLLSKHHPLRSKLERVRSLNVMWYELRGYKIVSRSASSFARSEKGAWIPLPMSHQVHFMKRVGLYDQENKIPMNPWPLREDGSTGLLKIFNQSYHSPWPMTRNSAYFKDWVKTACSYQLASKKSFRPFSQYGGHPVQADFVHHVIERPDGDKKTEMKHNELVEQRYGNIDPIRMGKMFKDTGLLQNMYSYKFSATAKVEKSQRDAYADALRISNFLAYARVHTIMALGSCNPGTHEISETRAIRNFFRLHVDTYKCAGKERDADGVPVVLGYVAKEVKNEEEPQILFVAGTLNCINSQMAKFCYSASNKSEKVCPMYKQLYFNDATILFEKLLRQQRTRHRHEKNFAKILSKDPTFTKKRFDAHMLDLKEEHISFLQHIIIGMLKQLGLTEKELPLGILEPRDLYVDPTEVDETELVGDHHLSPSVLEDLKNVDFASDELDYTQLSILSLTPPDVRAIAMLKLNQFPEEVDTDYLKSQVQQKVIKDNKEVWKSYATKVVQAALGVQWLEGRSVNIAFDPDEFKDPVVESEKIGIQKNSSAKLRDSELSLRKKSDDLRKSRSSTSASSRLVSEEDKALVSLDREIRSAAKEHGETELTELASRDDIPTALKRKLARMYMASMNSM